MNQTERPFKDSLDVRPWLYTRTSSGALNVRPEVLWTYVHNFFAPFCGNITVIFRLLRIAQTLTRSVGADFTRFSEGVLKE